MIPRTLIKRHTKHLSSGRKWKHCNNYALDSFDWFFNRQIFWNDDSHYEHSETEGADRSTKRLALPQFTSTVWIVNSEWLHTSSQNEMVQKAKALLAKLNLGLTPSWTNWWPQASGAAVEKTSPLDVSAEKHRVWSARTEWLQARSKTQENHLHRKTQRKAQQIPHQIAPPPSFCSHACPDGTHLIRSCILKTLA